MSSGSVPKGASDYCLQRLKAMGVQVLLNERVTERSEDNHHFVTRSGARLQADVAFVCTGIVPNSALLASDPTMAACLDGRGFARVDDHLRLAGFEHVFVGGDVAAIREEKLAQTAEFHGDTIARNLLARGSQPVASYATTTRPMLVSLGRVDGAFVWGERWFGGLMPALLKEVVEFKVMVAYRWRAAAIFQTHPPHDDGSAVDELKAH
eukprot:TRINITY_DN194_c0_g1_i2.p1 TRINITY_DN194_c0_g1~~TRINITY_DN194_c0_g1_i2.p1  ORF type:complete len:209 (+),score=100.37 TRINITY_DN194_c0_g1_i2:89-715(+)